MCAYIYIHIYAYMSTERHIYVHTHTRGRQMERLQDWAQVIVEAGMSEVCRVGHQARMSCRWNLKAVPGRIPSS